MVVEGMRRCLRTRGAYCLTSSGVTYILPFNRAADRVARDSAIEARGLAPSEIPATCLVR